MNTKMWGAALGLAVGLLLSAAAQAQADAGANKNAPLSAADYARWPSIEDVVISPSGKRLAVLVFGRNGTRRLGVMDLDPIGNVRAVGGFDDADVTSVRWVNDDRLVYEAFPREHLVREGRAGTFAVNHDGTETRQLIVWSYAAPTVGSTIVSRVLPYGWYLHSTAGDGSDDVFVYLKVRDGKQDLKNIQLARLNTRTGSLKNLSYGFPEYTREVWFDPAREPRVLQTHSGGVERTFWREPGQDNWVEVANNKDLDRDFDPWYVAGDGSLIARTGLGGVQVLQRFDLKARKLDPEPAVHVKGFDIMGGPELDGRTRQLMGVHLVVDRPMTYWFDDNLARLQEGIDAALPGRTNRLYCGECSTTRFIVILSASDRHPGEYLLFDRKTSSLQRIGVKRPWIAEASQGRRSFHRYEARDGLRVPVYVTHPAGAADKTPLPTVLLVHGGPLVRGSDLLWHADAQFLASRGYRVIEPEFRGSRGFGYRHHQAGWKQWGTGIQDDLADAVAWGVKQGLVDGSRVCVMGASFGGYSALMAPIRHPQLFRCAISYAGVTDPMFMYDVTWSDISQDSLTYSLPITLGDPVKDAALLADASPLKRVAELKVPVLLAHGGLDRRVPLTHARSFTSAAEKAGVKIEKVEYPGDAHGFNDPETQADYYRRVEAFLATHLKK
jgi:dienelactone hydrolase